MIRSHSSPLYVLFMIGYSEPTLYEPLRECAVKLAICLLHWACNSHEIKQKFLTNGLLFFQIKAIKISAPYLEEKVLELMLAVM